ncbi:MAG: hypothetical protein AAFN04_16935, partial [Pseudomonadota bacterium]
MGDFVPKRRLAKRIDPQVVERTIHQAADESPGLLMIVQQSHQRRSRRAFPLGAVIRKVAQHRLNCFTTPPRLTHASKIQSGRTLQSGVRWWTLRGWGSSQRRYGWMDVHRFLVLQPVRLKEQARRRRRRHDVIDIDHHGDDTVIVI